MRARSAPHFSSNPRRGCKPNRCIPTVDRVSWLGNSDETASRDPQQSPIPTLMANTTGQGVSRTVAPASRTRAPGHGRSRHSRLIAQPARAAGRRSRIVVSVDPLSRMSDYQRDRLTRSRSSPRRGGDKPHSFALVPLMPSERAVR